MFEINATLVIFLAMFLGFMFLVNEIMLKPIGKVLALRAIKIQSDLDAGQQARNEARQVLENYEQALQQVRSDAQDLISKAIEQANRARSKEIGAVISEGQSRLERAINEIAAERANLIDTLVVHEKELVALITQKVLGEPIDVKLDSSQVRRILEEAC